MTFTKVKKKASHKCETMWDEAIRDARALLAGSKLRTGKLKAAIRYFEEQKEAGEPWPGTKKRRKAI